MGGVNKHFSSNLVVLQNIDPQYITRVEVEGSQTNVIWHIPSGGNNFRNEATFDARFGGMPTFSRTLMVLVDEGVQFIIQEAVTDWTVAQDRVWLPSKTHLTTYVGGEKKPKAIRELVTHFDWYRKIEKSQFNLAFELDATDEGRPTWTDQIMELLGEPQRAAMMSRFVVEPQKDNVER